MKHFSIPLIIHIFALLHAAVALLCRLSGIEDAIFLTILTMAMILLICLKKRISIEFTAASIVVANIIGYLMGNLGADILDNFLESPLAVHAISSAITTEILGWSIVLFTRLSRHNTEGQIELSKESLIWILSAVATVFVLRLGITVIFSNWPFESDEIISSVSRIFSNSLGLITLLCINIVYVRYIGHKIGSRSLTFRSVVLIGFMCLASLLETVLVGHTPFSDRLDFNGDFMLFYVVSFIAEITVYCLVFMANYTLNARETMQEERGKANMAQYRYMKLKHQVNPHFLFNSLNILDCLVCDEKNEDASIYIHKLAGIYRYMIKSEDEDVVPLRDELSFVNQYVDLLSIRVPAGLEVRMNVPEEMMGRYVLPCAVQLLIENATKHNVVNKDNPLIINVDISKDRIVVTNNIIPKVGRVESTGLGLKYLRQQYMDICGKSIAIEHTDRIFSVTLPLI